MLFAVICTVITAEADCKITHHSTHNKLLIKCLFPHQILLSFVMDYLEYPLQCESLFCN